MSAAPTETTTATTNGHIGRSPSVGLAEGTGAEELVPDGCCDTTGAPAEAGAPEPVTVNCQDPSTGWPSSEITRKFTAYFPAGAPGFTPTEIVAPATTGSPACH